MAEAGRVHDIRVGAEFLAEFAAHLGDFERVGEAGAHEVIACRAEDLRFLPESAQA